MGVRTRRTESDYLKVDDEILLMMTQFTKLSEKPGAKTSSKRYIGDASSSSSITGYEASCDFEGDQIVDDKVVKYITDIGKLRKTGTDAETEFYQVELDRPANAEKSYYCRKSTVSVQVDELPDNDGDFGLTGVLNYKGDPVEGTFNTETKAFTEGFTAKTSAKVSE